VNSASSPGVRSTNQPQPAASSSPMVLQENGGKRCRGKRWRFFFSPIVLENRTDTVFRGFSGFSAVFRWDTICLVLGAAEPLTRQEIRAAWPAGVTPPHDTTLWRWLDRAVELGLACRTGKGTKTEPYRYGLRR